MIKASILSLLAWTTAIFSHLVGTAPANCLVEGNIMFVEGWSMGHLGIKCLNSMPYNATGTVCEPNGEMIETPAVYTCPMADPEFDPKGLFAMPFCVQLLPPRLVVVLCLLSLNLQSNCIGVDDGKDLPQTMLDPLNYLKTRRMLRSKPVGARGVKPIVQLTQTTAWGVQRQVLPGFRLHWGMFPGDLRLLRQL